MRCRWLPYVAVTLRLPLCLRCTRFWTVDSRLHTVAYGRWLRTFPVYLPLTSCMPHLPLLVTGYSWLVTQLVQRLRSYIPTPHAFCVVTPLVVVVCWLRITRLLRSYLYSTFTIPLALRSYGCCCCTDCARCWPVPRLIYVTPVVTIYDDLYGWCLLRCLIMPLRCRLLLFRLLRLLLLQQLPQPHVYLTPTAGYVITVDLLYAHLPVPALRTPSLPGCPVDLRYSRWTWVGGYDSPVRCYVAVGYSYPLIVGPLHLLQPGVTRICCYVTAPRWRCYLPVPVVDCDLPVVGGDSRLLPVTNTFDPGYGPTLGPRSFPFPFTRLRTPHMPLTVVTTALIGYVSR